MLQMLKMIDLLWREVLKCLVFFFGNSVSQLPSVALKACSSCHTTICETHRFRDFHGSSCLHCGFSWWLLGFWKFWHYNCTAVDGVGCQQQQGHRCFWVEGWSLNKMLPPIQVSSQNFFLVWHLLGHPENRHGSHLWRLKICERRFQAFPSTLASHCSRACAKRSCRKWRS